MTVYIALTDAGLPAITHPQMRSEFSSQAAAHRWFDDYVNSRINRGIGSRTGIKGGSASAVMQIYRHRYDEVPIARLRVADNPNGTRRVINEAEGDRIDKGAAVAKAGGVDIGAVVDGYRAALLAMQPDYTGSACSCAGVNPCDHAAPLSRRFTVDDMAGELVTRIWANVRYAIGRHPLAARLYVAAVGSRTLGWDLYADQVHKWCGFRWRTGAGELHAYMVRLSHSIPVVHVIERNGVLIDSTSVRRSKQ
ncbi:hypothetical protein [Nocardia sp. NPDC047648]|uniref:hypothetical protein n=1 Tax=Nocardia sp. NPDC047648 TaxID=3155625 RepID=UPI0033ED1B81